MSLESGEDTLAIGAARAWSGAEDALFWALREYPREDVRKALSCLSGTGLGHGMTHLDPALYQVDLAAFRERVVPALLTDRSRSARRRARLAGALSRLPMGIEVPLDCPPMRLLEADAERWAREGGEFRFSRASADPELEALRAELKAVLTDKPLPPEAVLAQAARRVADASLHPRYRDILQADLIRAIVYERASLTPLAEEGIRAGDRHLVLGVLEKADLPLTHLVAALTLWSDDPAIQGAVLANREARKDANVQRLLLERAGPHALYTLARARLGVQFTRRAVRALAPVDADRALRLIEMMPSGMTLPVAAEDWSHLLEHPDREIRLRALALTTRTSPLRLVPR